MKITVADRIKQADAARILGCVRQRIQQRIKNGSLVSEEVIDAVGNKTVYCSLKQVQSLKETLDSNKKRAK